LHDILDNLCEGRGKPEDAALLVDVANNMMGNTICAFADGTAMPMLGFVQKFRDEFLEAGRRGVRDGTLAESAARLVAGGRA
jgi:NADH-quinone oxidoreductase subunit F